MIQIKHLRVVVLTCILGSAACLGSGPRSIAPMGLAPSNGDDVAEWVDGLVPVRSRLYRIRPWRYRNERGSAAGRAVVRVAPPDSLRFDYQGPLRKSGKAAVVGDSALWVVPDDDFGGLVALAPVFWAGLGIPQPPPPGSSVFSLVRDDIRAWRYVDAGDTLTFIITGDPVTRIRGEIRRVGRTIGLSDVTMDPNTGLPIRSQIDLPIEPARFEFTVEEIDTLATFDATIWDQNR